ncbi:MAG: VOC family protein [Bacteroidota bacterium]
MSPIKPHLWFDSQAKEAAEFYTTLLPESAVTYVNQLHNTPSGDCDIVKFTLAGQSFMAISAGPLFQFNPSISFMVHFDTAEQIDEVWNKLGDGGKVMMALDKYPFSERYGWLADKYGVSWQLMIRNPEGAPKSVIVPSLMFTEAMAGKADEAISFYCSVFKASKRGTTAPRPQDMGPDKAGTLMYADFYINNTWLAAMDSAQPHGFVFNEAVSLLISCENQEEIDYYFTALSADPKSEQCGWLKDKYGVSWQVTSTLMEEVFRNGTREQIDRVTQAFMPMKKIDLAVLQRAYDGS